MATLHVFTGDAAADTVREALRVRDGHYLIQHDVISCGPLRDYGTRSEWQRERMGFWMALDKPAAFTGFPNDLVDDAIRVAAADQITLWVGAGLSDRLLLPALVHLADIEGFALPPIEIAEVVSHPTMSVPILGWGMLRAGDVGSPARRPVGPSGIEAARETWRAVVSDDPQAVPRLLDASDDMDLVRAMSTLIERYPDTVRGLSHWDASLIAATPDAGSSAFTIIGGAIGSNHSHLDPVGDMYLFWRLRRMAEAREPLVELAGDHLSIEDCRVTPTELGRRVRAGSVNAVAVNGIDDAIGGVRLHAAAGSPWYRRNGELIPSSRA